jgi:hypothetical protein
MVIFVKYLSGALGAYWPEYGMAEAVKYVIRHVAPPFELLQKLANGDYDKYSLTIGRYGPVRTVACTVHCVILTATYVTLGILALNKRQFSAQRD